jgi:hypothetical protein
MVGSLQYPTSPAANWPSPGRVVVGDKVTANLNNGVLEVHLPKAEEAKGKQTSIPVT